MYIYIYIYIHIVCVYIYIYIYIMYMCVYIYIYTHTHVSRRTRRSRRRVGTTSSHPESSRVEPPESIRSRNFHVKNIYIYIYIHICVYSHTHVSRTSSPPESSRASRTSAGCASSPTSRRVGIMYYNTLLYIIL